MNKPIKNKLYPLRVGSLFTYSYRMKAFHPIIVVAEKFEIIDQLDLLQMSGLDNSDLGKPMWLWCFYNVNDKKTYPIRIGSMFTYPPTGDLFVVIGEQIIDELEEWMFYNFTYSRCYRAWKEMLMYSDLDIHHE